VSNVGWVSEPNEKISIAKVKAAKMNNNKAAGLSGIVFEMLKALEEAGPEWVADMCNAVAKDGKIPENWSKSWLSSKDKGDALECGSYWRIKIRGVPVGLFVHWYLLLQIPAGISTQVDQGPYPWPVAVLLCKSDVPGHLY